MSDIQRAAQPQCDGAMRKRLFAVFGCAAVVLSFLVFSGADASSQGWAVGIEPEGRAGSAVAGRVLPTPDGGAFTVGSGGYQPFAIKLDSTGQIETALHYEVEGSSRFFFEDMAPIGDDFVAVGTLSDASFVMRLRPDGSVVWARKVGGFDHHFAATDVTTDGDGDIYVLGNHGIAPWLSRLDAETGSPRWESTFVPTYLLYGVARPFTVRPVSMALTDNAITIVGNVPARPDPPLANELLIAMRVSRDGESEWVRAYLPRDTTPDGGDELRYSARATAAVGLDGGRVAVAATLEPDRNTDEPDVSTQRPWVLVIEPGGGVERDFMLDLPFQSGVYDMATTPRGDLAVVGAFTYGRGVPLWQGLVATIKMGDRPVVINSAQPVLLHDVLGYRRPMSVPTSDLVDSGFLHGVGARDPELRIRVDRIQSSQLLLRRARVYGR